MPLPITHIPSNPATRVLQSLDEINAQLLRTPEPTSAKVTQSEFFDDVFYDIPLNDESTEPVELKRSKDMPLAVDDTDVLMPTYFGMARLEKPQKIGSISPKVAFDRYDPQLRGLPIEAMDIMASLTKTNGEQLYPSNSFFVLHKRKGFPPTMEQLTPSQALLELKQGNHVKISLARVQPWIEAGKRDLVVVKTMPDRTYRLETFGALTNWWNSVGWAFQLGNLPGTKPILR